MRSSIESRRCGCNAIIGLRESCAVCTSRRRAELHMAGYCRSDGTGQPYDCGMPSPDVDAMVDWAIGEARKLGLSGHEADAFINRQVASEVAGDAVRPPKPLPPWPIPAIGETCSYEVALRDMGNRPDARYRTDGPNGTSEYRGDPVCGLRNQNGWPSSFSGEYPLIITWTRVA
jgi:hypothetical protein